MRKARVPVCPRCTSPHVSFDTHGGELVSVYNVQHTLAIRAVTGPDLPFRCHTGVVLTTKPRHTITETESVAHALEVARRRWPGQPVSRLLAMLILKGASAVERETDGSRVDGERRLAALTELAGYYPENYLGRVRDGWAE